MSDVVLAIDAGTTGVTTLLVDHEGNIRSRGYQAIKQYYPNPGWVEHDPEQIWQAVLAATGQALSQSPECKPVALGCANQRETLLVWDKVTGAPLHKAIVWQCRRSESICEELREQGLEAEIRLKTGLRLDPYFSGTKALWLTRNHSEVSARVQQRDICFGTVDTWLCWKLSGGEIYSTDPTNASRTMCYDINRLDWDDHLLSTFGLNRDVVPSVAPTSYVRGRVSSPGLLEGLPIAAVAGDQQAALFGQACFDEGLTKATYGTGCFVLTTTGTQRVDSTSGLITTLTADTSSQSPRYALEGSVFVAGAAFQWCQDNLHLFSGYKEGMKLADSVEGSGGVVFVPAFTGLGSPYWAPEVRGAILGLTGGSNSTHIVRAAVDSMAYQAQDVVESMKEAGVQIKELRVDGGAAANDRLMQLQADISGVPISRQASVETTALGAAFLAGLAVGFWRDEAEVASLRRQDTRFMPSQHADTAHGTYKEWSRAVNTLLSEGSAKKAAIK